MLRVTAKPGNASSARQASRRQNATDGARHQRDVGNFNWCLTRRRHGAPTHPSFLLTQALGWTCSLTLVERRRSPWRSTQSPSRSVTKSLWAIGRARHLGPGRVTLHVVWLHRTLGANGAEWLWAIGRARHLGPGRVTLDVVRLHRSLGRHGAEWLWAIRRARHLGPGRVTLDVVWLHRTLGANGAEWLWAIRRAWHLGPGRVTLDVVWLHRTLGGNGAEWLWAIRRAWHLGPGGVTLDVVWLRTGWGGWLDDAATGTKDD